MSKVIMLTKDNCPFCEIAKRFIESCLDEDQVSRLEYVHRETNLARYEYLYKKHNIATVPSFIKENGEVLSDSKPSAITEFLEEE